MGSHRWVEVASWAGAIALVLIGAITVVAMPLSPATFGWFAYAPLSDAVFVPGGIMVVSWTTIVGAAVLAVGLTAVGFLAGWRMAKRRARKHPTT